MKKHLKAAPFYVLILALTVMTWACSGKAKRLNRLKDFPSAEWIIDRDGCNATRVLLKDKVLNVKHLMRGFKMSQIESVLGKPDAEELSERGQRYYIYFIDPGPKCDVAAKNPTALFVRFSAVGLATEFTIQPFPDKK